MIAGLAHVAEWLFLIVFTAYVAVAYLSSFVLIHDLAEDVALLIDRAVQS